VALSGDFDIIFDNGARLEQTVDNLQVEGTYLSPGGAQCGSFVTSGDFTTSNGRVDYSTAGGEMFTLRQNGDSYDVVCPGGETVTLDDAEQEVIDSCTTSADSTSSCTTPDFSDFNPDDINTGDFACTQDSDCPRVSGQDWRCCGPAVLGTRYCFAPEACAYL
jgi:hypothetical protein